MALILSSGVGTVDMSKWTFTNITSQLTATTAQDFVVSSTADLSEYDAISICAVYNSAKTGDYTQVTGCSIVYQINKSASLDVEHMTLKNVLINNISSSGFTLR